MLTGDLQSWRKSAALRRYSPIMEFLEELMVRARPAGRYELADPAERNETAFVEVQEKMLSIPDPDRFESHRRYIDIQCAISGTERLLVTTKEAVALRVPYDAEKDILWYSGPVETAAVELKPGDFVLFFPEDVHQPGCAPAGVASGTVRLKAVGKWPVSLTG